MIKTFYPTPSKLIKKMISLLDRSKISSILEPSAGKGDILDYIKENYNFNVSAIEVEKEFQAILRDKKYKVIDSDFLSYSGLDKFDCIIMNPPFDNGCTHLMKAIDIMFNGQIVCLLNAETIKNPFSNERKVLLQKLEEHKASVEFIENAFIDAERKTSVEVALIYINIERDIESTLFNNCEDKARDKTIHIENANEIASRNTVEFLVEEFNATITRGTQFILDYFKYKPILKDFLVLSSDNERHYSEKNLNELYNDFLANARKSYWRKVLDIEEVKSRLTKKELDKFNTKVSLQSDMDFSEKNVRSFIIDLIGNYDKILTTAVEDLFDKFTFQHSWYPECVKNIHYFNGWKTNKSFFVNNKVIIPARWKSPYSNSLQYDFIKELNDIDLVMNYFTRCDNFVSLHTAISDALKEGKTSKIESSHFIVSLYQKGTMHLKFKSEDTLRRFNICATKAKHWLPEDYGRKEYSTMTEEEKDIVESFEGKENYTSKLNQIGYIKNQLLLTI